MKTTCETCNGAGHLDVVRKTLGGDREVTILCVDCYGTGRKVEKKVHREVTIIKIDENEFEIVEMQCHCGSWERGMQIIDETYTQYENYIKEEGLDSNLYTFLNYIEDCLSEVE